MFRSCQIIIRELCSLLKLYYSIHNSILICERGVVAAYHVVWECVVEQWLGVRRMLSKYDEHLATAPQHIPTQQWYAATTPRLQIRIECEYRNITLARNKAPWWWSDKIETCRCVLKCFKSVLCKIIVHSLVDELKWFCENARCYNKI